MMKYTGNMNKDLKRNLPQAIADLVTSNREKSMRLVEMARNIYAANPDWGRRITDTESGRDTLYVFMLHWFRSWKWGAK